MSRSYKKTPIVKDNCRYKGLHKRKANKAVRQKLKDVEYKISDGKSYQKEYESYNINDYIIRWTKEEAIKEYNTRSYWKDYFSTLEAFLNYWEKCMKRK